MGKLANPCVKNDIINQLSTGESSNRIANDYDVSGQRIRQIKKENLELIEQKAQELLKNLPDIVETAKHNINISKRISQNIANSKDHELIDKLKEVKDILQFKQLTNKLSADILRALGIFPAQSPSLVIQNIYLDKRQQVIVDDKFQRFLDYEAKTSQPIDMPVDIQKDVKSDDN